MTEKQAKMEDGRLVNLIIAESVSRGDWLLVKSNLAVSKLSENEAKEIKKAIKEVDDELKNK